MLGSAALRLGRSVFILSDANLLLACAMDRESETLLRAVPSLREVLTTGVGVRRAEATLRQRFERRRPSLLLFTGTCGQLAPTVGLGEVVCPEAWMFRHGPSFAVQPLVVSRLHDCGWRVSGLALTVPRPVVRVSTRRRLHESTGALVCDMEAAAVLRICAAYRVPCLAPKAVCDTADSGIRGFWTEFDNVMQRLAVYVAGLIEILTRQGY